MKEIRKEMKYEKTLRLKGGQFKLLADLKKAVAEMTELLHKAYDGKHKRRVRYSKLAAEDRWR